MKQELIKGKWYRFKAYDKNDKKYWYFKYKGDSDGMFRSTEHITDSDTYCIGGQFSYEYATPFEEVNINGIAHLLPADHPDLKQPFYIIY